MSTKRWDLYSTVIPWAARGGAYKVYYFILLYRHECRIVQWRHDSRFLLLSNWLNLSVYDRNIFGSSSVVFGNLRQSSENPRKCSVNVRQRSSGLWNNFNNLRKSSENDRKSSEVRQKRRHQHVYIIKRTLHVSSKIWILCSRGKNYISLVRCAHSWDIVLATRT